MMTEKEMSNNPERFQIELSRCITPDKIVYLEEHNYGQNSKNIFNRRKLEKG